MLGTSRFDRDGFLSPLEGVSALEARRQVEEIERSQKPLAANGHLTHRFLFELATEAKVYIF